MLHGQRAAIFNHEVQMRKRVYQDLVAGGYGVGALIESKAWNGARTGVVTTYVNSIPRLSYYNTRRIKYSKQVKINYFVPTREEYHYVGFDFAILGGGTDSVSTPYCSLFWPYEQERHRSYGAKVLSPSYDLDERVTDDIFEQKISLPDRLILPVDMVGLKEYETAYLHRKNLLS
jgi:hypothetical protein